jgi:putative SOS response-associated peptidase YedK
MCNLYSVTKGQDAIRDLFKIDRDRTGNLPSLAAVFPDGAAPVIRMENRARELINMRWGFPAPPNSKERYLTNLRNPNSPWWRPWLKQEYRCLVPFTSFCEYTDTVPKIPHWFALDDNRPLAAFAGIWRLWSGTRGTKKAPIDGEHLVYSFLTTAPNEVVRPIHAKAMPVILTAESEFDLWLNAPIEEALPLQRPLPADRLRVVATGAKADERWAVL